MDEYQASMLLKIMELNTQDLFVRLAYPLGAADLDGLSEHQWQQLGTGDEPLKSLSRLRGLAKVFAAEQPDVAMLCEVGGEESLATFNRLFLADAYEPYYESSQSGRGIECAFLVRRGLGCRVELETHRQIPVSFLYPHETQPETPAAIASRVRLLDLPPPGQRFLSRSIPELRLYPLDTATPTTPATPASVAANPVATETPADAASTSLVVTPKAPPSLILLMLHLKSPHDPDGIDPGGTTRRAAEVRAVIAKRTEIAASYGDASPIIVGGDLNGLASRDCTATAFAPLYAETDLKDALEIAGRATYERITHMTFGPSGETHANQLDYLLIPASLHDCVSRERTYVHRYRFDSDQTQEIQMPMSLRDRAYLPSDHYPVVCVIDIRALTGQSG